MMLFPPTFFSILVYGSVILAGLGGLFLLGLLIRDIRRDSIW